MQNEFKRFYDQIKFSGYGEFFIPAEYQVNGTRSYRHDYLNCSVEELGFKLENEIYFAVYYLDSKVFEITEGWVDEYSGIPHQKDDSILFSTKRA